jgi:hypothetical protein
MVRLIVAQRVHWQVIEPMLEFADKISKVTGDMSQLHPFYERVIKLPNVLF